MSHTESDKPSFTYCDSVSKRLNSKGNRPPLLHFPCGMTPVRSDASAEGRRGVTLLPEEPQRKGSCWFMDPGGGGRADLVEKY